MNNLNGQKGNSTTTIIVSKYMNEVELQQQQQSY